jgi:hypothetical protein
VSRRRRLKPKWISVQPAKVLVAALAYHRIHAPRIANADPES